MTQTLIPLPLRTKLVANSTRRDLAGHDPVPVLKLFNPMGAATWLAAELAGDGDTLFGLADLGFGCPELGYFSLAEIAAIRLPFGVRIERDLSFSSDVPLSRWADAARRHGSIIAAAAALPATGFTLDGETKRVAPRPSRRALRALGRAMAVLPDPDRTIFIRVRFDDQDYARIALDLGMSLPEVERGVARAILALDAATRQAGRRSGCRHAGRICAWLRAKLTQGWRR